MLVWALSGRTWVALAVTLNLSLLLGAINVAQAPGPRGADLAADLDFLGNLGFLLGMVPASRLVAGAAVAVAVTLSIWGLASRVTAKPAAGGGRGRRLFGRLVVAGVCVALLVSARASTSPATPGARRSMPTSPAGPAGLGTRTS